MVDRRGRNPRALLIDAKHVARGVGAEAAGRAETRDHRQEGAVRPHDAAPAAPGSLVVGALTHVEIEGYPEIAEAVTLRAIRVAVIGTGDVPSPRGGEIFVGDAIAIGVAQAGDLGALGHEQAVAFAQHAERLVQSGSEERVADFVGRAEHAVEQPDFAFTNGDGEFSVRQKVHAADLEGEAVAGFPLRVARRRGRTPCEDCLDCVALGGDETKVGGEQGDRE